MLLLDPFLRDRELFERVIMLALKLALTIGCCRQPRTERIAHRPFEMLVELLHCRLRILCQDRPLRGRC